MRKRADVEISVGSSFRPRAGMRGTEYKGRWGLENRVSEKWERVCVVWI